MAGEPYRRVPPKITPADDRYGANLDCTSYALANGDVRYDWTMAPGLGRLREDVSAPLAENLSGMGRPR